jgi:translation initiation factor IF-2
MTAASVLPPGFTATTGSSTHLELGAVVVVVVLFVALLLVRAKQGRDQKIRKAASEGYYDPDVARYVHGPIPDAPLEGPMDDPDRSLAPTFVAPVRNKATKRGTHAAAPVPPPRPVSTAFGAGDGLPPRPVPAFDQVAAISARPASAPSPSAPAAPLLTPPPQPPPPPPRPMPAVAPGSSLPRMEQPRPPARNDAPGR